MLLHGEKRVSAGVCPDIKMARRQVTTECDETSLEADLTQHCLISEW